MAVTGTIAKTVDIDQGITCVHLGRLFAEADANAHTFKITVYASSKPLDMSNSSITAYFIRNDDSTVLVTGSVSKNVVTVSLPASCYIVNGRFSFIIRATSGSYKTSVFWADGTVSNSTTDSVVDPGKTIPSIDELLAKISEMEKGTAAANTAASNANKAASNAESAANEANRAASEANSAISDASKAAAAAYEAANTARETANDAATAANDAATKANTAANKADTATKNANDAATKANTAASNADTATSKANTAAANASKWTNVKVTVTMRDTDFAPICTVTDSSTGGKLMEFEIPIGPTGLTPNITVGKVTTGLPGTDVIITQRGTKENPILDFVIPRGNTGAVENLPLGNTNPMPLGAATPGTSDEVSRKDHVHAMPTAAQVGAVAKAGDTMTGNLIVERTFPVYELAEKTTGVKARFQINGSGIISLSRYDPDTDAWTAVLSYNPSANVPTRFVGAADRLSSARKINGVEFDGSKDITVADETKVAKAGSTMTGNLTISSTGTSNAIYSAQNSAGYAIRLQSNGSNNNTGIIGYDPTDDSPTWTWIAYYNASTKTRIFNGNANTATKLASDRRISVALGTAAASGTTFDGSKDVSVGVTGTLQVGNGGTGATTPADALKNLGAVWKAGETLNVANVVIGGHISSSVKTFYGMYNVGKPISASSVSVTALSGSLRGINGYLDATNANAINFLASPYTVSLRIENANAGLIYFMITTSDVVLVNGENNTPATYAGSINLRFS